MRMTVELVIFSTVLFFFYHVTSLEDNLLGLEKEVG